MSKLLERPQAQRPAPKPQRPCGDEHPSPVGRENLNLLDPRKPKNGSNCTVGPFNREPEKPQKPESAKWCRILVLAQRPPGEDSLGGPRRRAESWEFGQAVFDQVVLEKSS